MSIREGGVHVTDLLCQLQIFLLDILQKGSFVCDIAMYMILGCHVCGYCAVYRAAEEGQPRKAVVVVGREGSVRSSVLVPLVFAVPCRSADCRGGRRSVCCVVSYHHHHQLHCATFSARVVHWTVFH